jgi:hypothetical protein
MVIYYARNHPVTNPQIITPCVKHSKHELASKINGNGCSQTIANATKLY